ncbi:MAG TPA: CHAT domain-containing protein, partial [Candidatus Polarisedimenticolia bacterium]|nr:CHAT domain-containing protein [Candidatus Polarisedimenticolia bacterium]
MHRLPLLVPILGAALPMLAGGTAATAGAGLSMDDPVTLEECDARVIDNPDELDSYLCYWIVSRKSGRPEIAAQRLDALRRLDPDNHKATLYLALIRGDQTDPGALALARQAAEGLAADGDIVGEARARVQLDSVLRYRGAIDEADAALARALELARISGDPEVLAQAETARAWTSLSDGDYSLAWSLYCKLERDLFPGGPSWLQYRVLRGLGRTARATGRLHRSLDYFQRSAELVARSGNLYAEALDRFFVAQAAAELQAAGEMRADDVLRLTDDALRVARGAGNRGAEGLTLLLRARQPSRDLQARLADARGGLEVLRRSDDVEDIGAGLRLLASLLVEENPAAQFDAALRLVDEAIDLARTGGWPGELARAYLTRAAIGTGHLSRPEVIADYLTAIEQIETMRDLQSDRQIRGRFLWDWASAYYRLARFALEAPGSTAEEGDLDLAFATIERLRGRLLGDLLDAAHATEAAFPAGPEREAFIELRARITGAQRRLLSPGLSPAERRAAHADLERLEMEEAYLGTRLARSRPAYATLSRAQIPTIDSLQRTLDKDQALIAYQIATPDETGARSSWAVVLTREGSRVLPLPEGDRLEEKVAIFIGLLHRRDGLEAEAAARLYDDLLAAPLGWLGDGISRLVIIPDGILHRLPFDALREGPAHGPLAARFAISLVPSASLWSYWKRTATEPAGDAVLALADPSIPGAGSAWPAAERSASLGDGIVLGPLPHARREARAVVRRIGGASRLLLGDEASERFLKSADLTRFGVL